MIELTVILKGDDSTYRQKFLVYEEVSMHGKDPVIMKCINEAMSNFKLKPDTVKIRTNMEL